MKVVVGHMLAMSRAAATHNGDPEIQAALIADYIFTRNSITYAIAFLTICALSSGGNKGTLSSLGAW
jgi:hypothetical protein